MIYKITKAKSKDSSFFHEIVEGWLLEIKSRSENDYVNECIVELSKFKIIISPFSNFSSV